MEANLVYHLVFAIELAHILELYFYAPCHDLTSPRLR